MIENEYRRGWEEGFLLGGIYQSYNGGFGKGKDGDVKMVKDGLYLISDVMNPDQDVKTINVDILYTTIPTIDFWATQIESAFASLGYTTYTTYEIVSSGVYTSKEITIHIIPADNWEVLIWFNSHSVTGVSEEYYINCINTSAYYYFKGEFIASLPFNATTIDGGVRYNIWTFSDEFTELTNIKMFSLYTGQSNFWFHKVGKNFVRFGIYLYDSEGNLNGRISYQGGNSVGVNSKRAMTLVNPTLFSENERKYSGYYPILIDEIEQPDILISPFYCSTTDRYFYCAKEAGGSDGILFYALLNDGYVAAYILVDAGGQYAEYVDNCIAEYVEKYE